MADLIGLLIWLIVLGGMFALGFICYFVVKSNRETYLTEMEAKLAHITVTDLKNVPQMSEAVQSTLVMGCVVVANNYFLSLCAYFRNLFGGEVRGYTDLCTAARRIALVRLKLQAQQLGADTVCCLRYETMVVQQGNQQKTGGVELLAYGTALVQPKSGKAG